MSGSTHKGKWLQHLATGEAVPIPAETTAITFSNACHVAEVEIDPETGTSRILRYIAVEDVGTVLNPMLLDGQMLL